MENLISVHIEMGHTLFKKHDNLKFKLSKHTTISQLMYRVRQRIKLKPEQALFIFLKKELNTLPLPSYTLSHYNKPEYLTESDLIFIVELEDVFGFSQLLINSPNYVII